MSEFIYGNSKPLPDIYTIYPQELQKNHPFAVIAESMYGAQYWLKIFSEPVVDGIGYGKCRQATCVSGGTEWQDFGEETDYGEDGIMISSIVWSNHDILNSDGTLYLAASDPIPVGTAPQLDPLSLWLGWKTGN